MTTLPTSVLVKDQKIKTPWKEYIEGVGREAQKYRIRAEIRYDDQCGNGHNSFAITGTVDRWERDVIGPRWRDDMGGCIHDEIEAHFPEYRHLIKWHLTSSDGPMHYIPNVLYWLGWCGWCDGKPSSPPNLAYARKTAVWPELPEEFLAPLLPGGITGGQHDGLFKKLEDPIKEALAARLPALMLEFKRDIEALGFTY